MSRKELLKNVKRVVVKVGTSSISDGGQLCAPRITRLVQDILFLREKGLEVILVSSGAITAGMNVMNYSQKPGTIPEKQALASIGQAVLINEYRRIFSDAGIQIGQILLTEDDMKHRRRFLNARHTLKSLLAMKAIPIINENDTVVVKEIKVGDNDTLSAYITGLMDADLLVLLSDVDGFFWDLKDDEPIEEVTEINDEILSRAGDSYTTTGTGGMLTKLKAADIVMRYGEKMIIANSRVPQVLQKIISGEKIGTIFIGKNKHLNSRKKWVSIRRSTGTVVVDEGAEIALISKKKSLLASGITRINGTFDMGSVVSVHSCNGTKIAKGIVNYNSGELNQIKGLKSSEIKKVLGSKFFDEVINRDDLIIY